MNPMTSTICTNYTFQQLQTTLRTVLGQKHFSYCIRLGIAFYNLANAGSFGPGPWRSASILVKAISSFHESPSSGTRQWIVHFVSKTKKRRAAAFTHPTRALPSFSSENKLHSGCQLRVSQAVQILVHWIPFNDSETEYHALFHLS